jgi:hypothetical protein
VTVLLNVPFVLNSAIPTFGAVLGVNTKTGYQGTVQSNAQRTVWKNVKKEDVQRAAPTSPSHKACVRRSVRGNALKTVMRKSFVVLDAAMKD